MANLYGTANCPGMPQPPSVLSIGIDTALVPGTALVIHTTAPLIAPSPGYFYAMVYCSLALQIGPTLPNGLNMAAAIGAGSYNTGWNIVGWPFQPNAQVCVPYWCWTVVSQVAWQGAGSVVNVGINIATNPATVHYQSAITVQLMRAPDQ